MIVEDNQVNQKIAAMIVESLGHKPIQIYDGNDAIEAAQKHRPDLIILDIQLPNISGVEICKILKSDDKLHKIPVIVVTILSSEEDRKRITNESKCDDYIAKPFFPKNFSEAIGKFIRVKQVDWDHQSERK